MTPKVAPMLDNDIETLVHQNRIALAQLEARLVGLEISVARLTELSDVLGDLRVTVERLNGEWKSGLSSLKAQMKVTWALMILMISGMLSVAFSLWEGGP